MSGRRSRDKGNRAERALVRFLQDRGFAAERIPLSGSAGGKFAGDISVPLLGHDRIAEVKCRASGFRELYAWLDSRDILILKADRREPLRHHSIEIRSRSRCRSRTWEKFAMTIEVACFGNLNRDAELRTSKNGKPYLFISLITGRDDTAQRISVLCFDEDAIAQADKFVRGARAYVEGSLNAKIWIDQQGQARVDLSAFSWHTRLAAIGRNKPKRDRAETPVAGGYVSPRSAPANRLPGSGQYNDEIPFVPEVR